MQSTSSAAAANVAEVQRLNGDEAAKALPIRVLQASEDVEGIATQVIIYIFADQTVVFVTQLGKVGFITQVTMNTRPSQPSRLPWNEDDQGAQPAARTDEDELASLLNTCSVKTLFGTHPSGQKALYNLYCTHIAITLAQAGVRANTDFQESANPVIVGLALKQQAKQTNGNGVADDDDDDDDDFGVIAEQERERFQSILSLVRRACQT